MNVDFKSPQYNDKIRVRDKAIEKIIALQEEEDLKKEITRLREIEKLYVNGFTLQEEFCRLQYIEKLFNAELKNKQEFLEQVATFSKRQAGWIRYADLEQILLKYFPFL